MIFLDYWIAVLAGQTGPTGLKFLTKLLEANDIRYFFCEAEKDKIDETIQMEKNKEGFSHFIAFKGPKDHSNNATQYNALVVDFKDIEQLKYICFQTRKLMEFI